VINKSKLAEEDYYLLEEIIKRHPNWLDHAENHPGSESTFNIKIPCPTIGNPPICIDRLGDGANIIFGPLFIDWYDLRKFVGASFTDWFDYDDTLCVDALDILIEEITSERIIIAQWKTKLMGKKWGRLNPEEYKSLFEVDKILISISWLGKYNYNYNGEWSEPYVSNQNI
jgi:hypothetical protein